MDRKRDWILVRRFVDEGSQEAFAELTSRYLRLVYGTCLSELRDSSLAEDVSQAVFLILARRAPSFRRSIVLPAWLFDTCRYAARNAQRSEQRRRRREEEVAVQMERQARHRGMRTATLDDVDEALRALSGPERTTLQLRYGSGYSLQEIGNVLGISEDAARKRVERSLGKLRGLLARGGLMIGLAAAADLLVQRAAGACPPGLADRIAEMVAGQASTSATAASTIAQGTLTTMKLTTTIRLAALMIGLAGAIGIAAARVSLRHDARGVDPAASTAGIQGTDSQAVALYRQVAAAYRGLTTLRFTETDIDARAPRIRTIRFSFQRPDKIDMRVDYGTEAVRFVTAAGRMGTVPQDRPQAATVKVLAEGQDPISVTVDAAAGMAPSIRGDEAITLLAMPSGQLESWLARIGTGRAAVTLRLGQPLTVDGRVADVIVEHAPDGYAVYQIDRVDHLIRRETSNLIDPRYNVDRQYAAVSVNESLPATTFWSQDSAH
jgi:RNA polymerase sigma factor (sigma-70 family)